MSSQKSSGMSWWPKRVFNWSSSDSTKSVTNESIDVINDSTSCVSTESSNNDIVGNNNNKYINLLVKRIRKRFKMSGEEERIGWMSDMNSKECYECGDKFTTIRRRHHCRICGQIFCTKCCDQEIDSKFLGLNSRGSVRSCNYCHKIVNQYISDRNADTTAAVARDSEFNHFREIIFSQNLIHNSGPDQSDHSRNVDDMTAAISMSPHSLSAFPRKSSIGFREEDYTKPKARILSIDKEAINKIGSSSSPLHSLSSFGSYKTPIKICNNELDDDLTPLKSEEASHEPLWVKEINDEQDIQCFERLDLSLDSLKSNNSFESDVRLRQKTPSISPKRSTSTYDIELDIHKDRVCISRATISSDDVDKPSIEKNIQTTPNDGLSVDFEVTTSSSNWESLKEGTEEKFVYDSLNASYNHLYNKLLTQFLEEEELSLSWLNVIQKLSNKVSSVVRPNSRSDVEEMDIRNYLKIKTIANGMKSDCNIINGVVFTKNIANRKMRQTIIHPKILLLSCPIVYQRNEKKMTYLDSILLQENEYIQNLISKIVSYGPDVIVVEKTVARIAKDMLLDYGITLVSNVKPIIIERLSRFTGAVTVSSLDAQIGVPQLGFCQKFYLQTFNQKTLMFFDGCPQYLGLTVLLKGGPLEELKKIKSILSFMIFCEYNWQLERSFLMDEYCYPSQESIDTKDIANYNTSNSTKKDILLKEDRSITTSIVSDNSDPLRSMASEISTDILSPINVNVEEIKENSNEDNFFELTTILSHYLTKLQLSCSPFITISLPYLLTNVSNNLIHRKYFDLNIIWSKKFEKNLSKDSELLKVEKSLNVRNPSPIESISIRKHPLLVRNIKLPINSHEVKSLIADFRANGPFIENYIEESKPKPNFSETEIINDKKIIRIDALNPKSHQKLSVLFSSFSYASTNAPNYCVKPWIINMEFYGSNDIPLGGFLERYCFRPTYTCPSNTCSTPMIEHMRRFVHSNGCILIVLRQLQQKVEAAQDSIITWSWCQKCKTGTPYSTLSPDSWSLSFAKYLELKFSLSNYRRRATQSSVQCLEHSLHVDHFQFFAYKQIVASFKYMPVHIHEIILPPNHIAIYCDTFSKSDFIEDLKQNAIKGYEIYSLILEKLCSIKDETIGTKYETNVNEFMQIQSKERAIFRKTIEEIQVTLTSCNNESLQMKSICYLNDSLIQLKKMIAESVYIWNLKIQDFVTNKKKDEKIIKEKPNTSSIQPKASPVQNASNDEAYTPSIDLLIEDQIISSKTIAALNSSFDVINKADNNSEILKTCIEEQENECKETLEALNNIKLDESYDEFAERLDISREKTKLSVSSYTYEVDVGINDCIENGVNFEANSDNYAVYNLHESSDEYKKQDDNQSLRSSTEIKSITSLTSSVRPDGPQFGVKRIFKEFLSNANNLVINNPFSLSEHYILPNHRDSIKIVVKDDDPGSIIAYTLTSAEYERQLSDIMKQTVSPAFKKKLTTSAETDLNSDPNSNKGSNNITTQHLDIQFSESNAKFYCCVYFAEQFRKFRAHILDSNNDEELYIRSLSSCVPWKARGGKSGSTFCKTVNDRFILKEMSKLELQSFLNIANYYFEYCSRAIFECRPSLLARIVGVYRTSYKNTATNNASKLYLLVMENLFYKCNITQKFDLKGSMRNRLVDTNLPNLKADQIVLLDENLMQMTCDCPLYVHSHSKAILRTAIDNDSTFLSSHSVMDYSLLVGIEDQRNQFVVGIIDYIRPFTWDKKIESVVKLVGSQGKLPTIVQPDLYRIRFCEAMDQYFLCVPDKWYSIVDYNVNKM